MTTIRLDDKISEVESKEDQKVGDFLQSVISNIPPNRVVTQVILDGNTYASAAKDQGLEKTLETVRDVQIRTADRAIWAATGLDIALSCVERVKSSLIRSAELFRDQDSAKAHRFFAHCVEGLERFLEALTITRCAMNLNFNQIHTERGSLAKEEESLLKVLRGILELQEKNSIDEMADKIEYELLTSLSVWTTALRQLRNSANSNV